MLIGRQPTSLSPFLIYVFGYFVRDGLMVVSCMAVTLVFFKNQFVVIVGGRGGGGYLPYRSGFQRKI